MRRITLPRAAFRLAAGVLILLLAVAVAAMYIELHYGVPRSEPAGALSINAYEALVTRDDHQLAVTQNDSCATLQSVCPGPGHPYLTALQRWLDDLNRSQPPVRFAVIDAQLRLHLGAYISDIGVMLGAYQTQDQTRLDRAWNVGSAERGWLDDIAASIVISHQGTITAYIESVRAGNQEMGANVALQSFGGTSQVACLGIQSTTCESDLIDAMSSVEVYQARLVRVSAPDSLAPQDRILQLNLAQVDSALVALSTAEVAGDQAAFNSSRLSLQQAVPTVYAAIADVLNAQP